MAITSMAMLRKKTGMVIFVGMADRLVIIAMHMAPIAIPQSVMLLLPDTINNTVAGESTQP